MVDEVALVVVELGSYPSDLCLACAWHWASLAYMDLASVSVVAWNEESEKLIGIEGQKALVTLVTSLASKLQRIASYTGKRDNDVSQERSGLRSGIWVQDPKRW